MSDPFSPDPIFRPASPTPSPPTERPQSPEAAKTPDVPPSPTAERPEPPSEADPRLQPRVPPTKPSLTPPPPRPAFAGSPPPPPPGRPNFGALPPPPSHAFSGKKPPGHVNQTMGRPAPPLPPPWDMGPGGAAAWNQPPAQAWGPPGYYQAPPPLDWGPSGYAGYTPDHPWTTAVLVMGIIGLAGGLMVFGIGFLLSPVAWIMGSIARRKVKNGEYAPNAQLTAGWVMGIIGTVFLLFVVACFGWLITLGMNAQKQMAQAQWTVAETAAADIRQSLLVYRARHGGKLPGIIEGPIGLNAEVLNFDMVSVDAARLFDPDDFQITNLNTATGEFTIEVFGTRPNSPPGTYTLDQDNVETRPTPADFDDFDPYEFEE